MDVSHILHCGVVYVHCGILEPLTGGMLGMVFEGALENSLLSFCELISRLSYTIKIQETQH